MISKLFCLPDSLEELNYYNEYHFENVSFGIQRHQIKIFILWNFNITHILMVQAGGGGITKGFHLLLSPNSTVVTDRLRCCLRGDNVSQLSRYHFFLVSLIWDTTCFQCNQAVKSALTLSLAEEE